MVFTHSVTSTLDASTNTPPRERLANSPDKHTCDRYCRHLRSARSQKYVRKCLLQAITASPAPCCPSVGQTDMCSARWGCRVVFFFFSWLISSCRFGALESRPRNGLPPRFIEQSHIPPPCLGQALKRPHV